MAHHALRTRHALPIATSLQRTTTLRAAFTSAARRPDDDDDAEVAPSGKRRGFRLKGKEVRQALEWLDVTGEQYRRPAPGRPNYLRQQDGGGRAVGHAAKGEGREAATPAAEEEADLAAAIEADGAAAEVPDEDVAGGEPPSGMLAEMESSVGGEVVAQEAEPEARGAAAPRTTRGRLQGAVRRAKLGPDPRPYGLNLYYRSERVLSEELREAIYAEWAERKTPLREISKRYFVCVERVAAVVRMKQIERDWLEEVSLFSFSLLLEVMIHHTHR
jgi:hypothetical protein